MSEINVTELNPYVFRKLCATDIAPMCKVISKLSIKEMVKSFSAEGLINNDKNKDEFVKKVGLQVIVEMADTVITHIPDCEKELFELLSGVSNLSVQEIKKLDLAVFAEMIMDFCKKEEFADFLTVVSKLFK